MKVVQWIMAHKKKLGLAIVALLGAAYAVLNVVPGDQKEDVVKNIHDKAASLVDQLPDDAAE